MSDDSRAIVPVSGSYELTALKTANPRLTRGLSRIKSLDIANRVGVRLQHIECFRGFTSAYGEAIDIGGGMYVGSWLRDATGTFYPWAVCSFDGQLLGSMSKIVTSREFLPSWITFPIEEPTQLSWTIRYIRNTHQGWIARAYYEWDFDAEDVDWAPFDEDRWTGLEFDFNALFLISKDFVHVHEIGLLPFTNYDEQENHYSISFGTFDDIVVALHGRCRYSLFRSGQPPLYINDDAHQGPYFYPVQVGDEIYAISGVREGRLTRFRWNNGRLQRTGEWHVADQISHIAAHGDLVLALEYFAQDDNGASQRVAAYRDGERQGYVEVRGWGALDVASDAFALFDHDLYTGKESIVVIRSGMAEAWAATVGKL